MPGIYSQEEMGSQSFLQAYKLLHFYQGPCPTLAQYALHQLACFLVLFHGLKPSLYRRMCHSSNRLRLALSPWKIYSQSFFRSCLCQLTLRGVCNSCNVLKEGAFACRACVWMVTDAIREHWHLRLNRQDVFLCFAEENVLKPRRPFFTRKVTHHRASFKSKIMLHKKLQKRKNLQIVALVLQIQ